MRYFFTFVVLAVLISEMPHWARATAPSSCSATVLGSQTVLAATQKQVRFHVVVKDCPDSTGSFEYVLETERTDTHEQNSTIRRTSWGPVHNQSDFTFDDGAGGLDSNVNVLSVLAQTPVNCVCP